MSIYRPDPDPPSPEEYEPDGGWDEWSQANGGRRAPRARVREEPPIGWDRWADR